ncbi:Hypothetical protein, putative [Bodo saltans]|uniref:Uncharacterized protein n=1 Tax=Bodo saltans TaxID=75058 RepID=A0A0S4IP42_BODSA|nr:Hypothetical protein, putative [Bodo saltans]|eukprot:CUF77766.1 Hypothetical protein, putative [Bodo saltans]
MLRSSTILRTATPASFAILGTTFPKPKRTGFGRLNKMRSKASDNTAWYDKGPVEWLPRPVRLSYDTIDQLRDWMMRETLDGRTEEFIKAREIHREWSQHPKMPVLGDVEPRFPHNLFKMNHRAGKRFLVRWHKANSPNNWMWMPKPSQGAVTPLHHSSPAHYPESWLSAVKQVR